VEWGADCKPVASKVYIAERRSFWSGINGVYRIDANSRYRFSEN